MADDEEPSFAERRKLWGLATEKETAEQVAKPGCVWIDVRGLEEWRKRHLSGALLLPCSRHDSVAVMAAAANGALPKVKATPLLVFCGPLARDPTKVRPFFS